jgi:hypothetical protein
MSLVDNFKKKIHNAQNKLQDGVDHVKEAAKKQNDKMTKAVSHGGLVKTFIHETSKYNPAAAVPRAAILAGIRVNMFGVATRLYPAFLTEAELKAGHFDVANAEHAKDAWKKVKTFYYNLGGDAKALEKNIRKSHNKPVFKTKKSQDRKSREAGFDGVDTFSNVSGVDDAAIAVAAIGLLSTIAKMIGDSHAAKNPYANKEMDTTGMDGDTPISNAELDKIKKAADEDKAKGLGLDGSDGGDTIWGIDKTLFIVGASILALATAFGGYKLYQHLNK